ncbi:MAG: (deoxy)nucleoside triphosphate pyrophosphohydrolase [Pirellulaceae bacterium]|nr:(deoxy)nucleoside triphosphate pyrophosphohydrolase [Pirellulaceae bacterium]
MHQPTPIAVAVVEHQDHFLIGLRPADVALAGYWEFPGGKIHADESPEQAAIRECREETEINVKIIARYPTANHQYPHAAVQLHFFRCSPLPVENSSAGPPSPLAPFRWVARQELSSYQFPAANSELLKRLSQSASGHSH